MRAGGEFLIIGGAVFVGIHGGQVLCVFLSRLYSHFFIILAERVPWSTSGRVHVAGPASEFCSLIREYTHPKRFCIGLPLVHQGDTRRKEAYDEAHP